MLTTALYVYMELLDIKMSLDLVQDLIKCKAYFKLNSPMCCNFSISSSVGMYMVVVEATEERACALVTMASALEDTT